MGLASSLSPLVVLALLCLAFPAHARDWFVRAGAVGGDGSREKPFRDPFQAITEAIRVTGGFGTRPAQVRDNTVLFVWNRSRPHDGSTSTGSGLALTGNAPAVVEGNVFQYIDNFAVRADSRLNEVVLTNNAFFRNWAAFRSTQGMPPPTVDEKSMQLLADLPFKKAEGNVVADGGFDIDPAFYASWFARTSQLTSLFTPEEWSQVAPRQMGGEPAKPGVGRALDWKAAAKLFPKNARVKGARPKPLETGSDR
ncbi:hypothetical protein D7V88_04920 [Corallococcus terminator]|uniref:Right-handed parallel beta-helix repeat-containing protein n=1 Tax=Corallococcus terminator TaxID=2316733 RepID=A0A3A8JBI8_9BACT|nr:hypothetical protein D7V88_04920 [Corallococcus terminator]